MSEKEASSYCRNVRIILLITMPSPRRAPFVGTSLRRFKNGNRTTKLAETPALASQKPSYGYHAESSTPMPERKVAVPSGTRLYRMSYRSFVLGRGDRPTLRCAFCDCDLGEDGARGEGWAAAVDGRRDTGRYWSNHTLGCCGDVREEMWVKKSWRKESATRT